MRYLPAFWALNCSLLLSVCAGDKVATAQVPPDFIPRKQSAPPGPPLSPADALKKMVVPEGFRVELVASEPDLMNPVAMAFDDRGRIFVTESFEYPRREPGPGRDRIKILEDKDGDGFAETVKIFAEGLNIPSGIAVGHGGVWVANAPDILFLEDTDGDDRADKTTVVVTGFGRDDTHELPNALTWGPDGALYGLNGVFNPSTIVQDGKTHQFTCAMFRIDPKTHKFDVFCEGTSNPWGIAFDHEGSAFVSACVIDHLWHLTESAYYRRQAGSYPPHTYFAESIVKHKHQMAAYCGIEFLDTDAYPNDFNNKLYMGNIHGGCINSDSIRRFGATYEGSGNPDFLTANDVWFMPVAQKVGPDGCLYVLDWYDRYHCYQDANADPKGVDRGHGRLYRIVHNERPKARVTDFSKQASRDLVDLLHDPNIFNRQRAQLHLQERGVAQDSELRNLLLKKAANESLPMKTRLHAFWSLAGSGPLDIQTLSSFAKSEAPELRAWAIRTIGRLGIQSPEAFTIVELTSRENDPRVLVEASITSGKLASKVEDKQSWNISNQLSILNSAPLAGSGVVDPILTRVVWQNMLPHLRSEQVRVADFLSEPKSNQTVASLVPRFTSYLLSTYESTKKDESAVSHLDTVFGLVARLAKQDRELASEVLNAALVSVKRREIQFGNFKPELARWIRGLSSQQEFAIPSTENWAQWDRWQNAVFQCHLILGDSTCQECVKSIFNDATAETGLKRDLLATANMVDQQLVVAAFQSAMTSLGKGERVDDSYLEVVIDLGASKLKRGDIEAFGKLVSPRFPANVLSKIAERLCQRAETSPAILELIANNQVRRELISPNTIRLLAQSSDAQVQQLVRKIWGTVNSETTKEREQIVSEIAQKLDSGIVGNAERGWAVFDRTCGQCHVMHGRGKEVGPNITANGRGAFDQLLVSVFNPSLVIGDAYKSVTLRTVDDEIITGLLVDRNEQRTVIKLQGGQERLVPADEIDDFKVDSKSLMPEGLETQMSDQELADLFALLALEKAPGAKENAIIPGTPAKLLGD